MHPVTRLCGSFVVGVVVAPWAGTGPWVPLVLASLAAALPFGGAVGLRGALVALLAGIAVAHGEPAGPLLPDEVVVVGARVGASTGRVGDVRVTRWRAIGGPWHPAEGRVRVDFGQRPPALGTRVLIEGPARRLTPRGLPGGPDDLVAASRVGVRSRVRARGWRVLGAARSQRGPTHDPSGLLRALALGDRSGVSEHTVEVLRRTGTSHLLAISGFHVSVVAMMAGAVAARVRRAAAVAAPSGLPPWELVVGVAAAMAYAWAAQAPLSAQRAAGLLLLGAVGRGLGRTVAVEPLLGLVAVAVLLGDPAAVSTPSFQLSFGAVVGLVRLGGPLLQQLPGGRLRSLSASVAATVSATAGTFPAAAWWFQELAPLSPVANLVALPLTSAVLVPAAAVASFGPEPLAGLAGVVGSWGASLLVACLEPMAVTPFRPAVGVMGCGALWVGLGLLPRWPGAAAALTVVALAVRGVPQVHSTTFLSVGQGDATLVEFADGRRWLVDGGPPGGAVAAWLRRRGVRRLDQVVITHNQRDHLGGLLPVVQTLRVGQLAVSSHDKLGVLRDAARQRGVPVVSADGLHPVEGFEGGPNDRSVVLSVGGVLLTGDIEAAGEAAVAASVGPHEVLKVPHHGSRSSSSVELLAAARPSVAVVSVGRHNPFGHPHDVVLARYARAGIAVLRTDRHGTLVHRGSRWWGWQQGRGWQRLLPMSGGGPLDAGADGLARRRPASADEEDGHRSRREQQAHALGEGEGLAQERLEEPATVEVAAEELQPGAGPRIQRQVEQHDLPVERPVAVEQVAQRSDGEQRSGLVQLHRMERHAVRSEGVLWKGHGPWARRRLAVAAARRVAAQAADPMGEGKGRGHHVPHREDGHAPAPHQREAQRKADDEGAVEHQPAAADVEQVGEAVDGLRVLHDEHEARAQQRQHREPEDEIRHLVEGHPDGPGAHQHDPGPHEEGHAAEEAVGVDRQAAELEQDGVHGEG